MRGVSGLRIADVSVCPDIPSANTNAAAIMLGERCAEFLRLQWGRGQSPAQQSQAQLRARL